MTEQNTPKNKELEELYAILEAPNTGSISFKDLTKKNYRTFGHKKTKFEYAVKATVNGKLHI